MNIEKSKKINNARLREMKSRNECLIEVRGIMLKKLQDERKGKITVFYCGNPVVGSILRGKCEQYGFNFRKEVF